MSADDRNHHRTAPGPARLVTFTSAAMAALLTTGALLPGRTWFAASIPAAAALASTAAWLWSRAPHQRTDSTVSQHLDADTDVAATQQPVETAPRPAARADSGSPTVFSDRHVLAWEPAAATWLGAGVTDEPLDEALPEQAPDLSKDPDEPARSRAPIKPTQPTEPPASTDPLASSAPTELSVRTGLSAQPTGSEQPAPATPIPAGPRFPVLHRASPITSMSWLLPREPAGPGIAADEATLGGLRLRAASVVGPGHRVDAKPRQDAYRIGRDTAGEHLIIAVADGMTDSRYSDVGANVAALTLVTVLRAALDGGEQVENLDPLEIFTAAAAQMYQTAKARGWEPDDVRAVATAAVIPAEADAYGLRRFWAAAVGDASAWTLAEGCWRQVVGDVKGGMDASRVHTFLPHVVDKADCRLHDLAPGDALALMSDGVSDAFALGPAACDWFAERWRRPPPVGTFLLDVGYDQAQMHDDRTAVMAWCSDEGQEL